MNCEKAQNLFSDLYEGSLHGGLKETVSRHISECPSCEHEYQVFSSLYSSLSQPEEVPVPDDLSERIARKLDKVFWEQAQSAKKPMPWLRLTAWGAAAALLLTLGFLTYDRFGSLSNIPAGFIANVAPEPLSLQVIEGQPRLKITPGRAVDVDIYVGGSQLGSLPPTDAAHLEKIKLQELQAFNSPLNVQLNGGVVVWVSLSTEQTPYAVFIPGTVSQTEKSFSGNLLEGLKKISEKYGVIIFAKIESYSVNVRADLTKVDAQSALKEMLQNTKLRAVFTDGYFKIQ